MNDDVLECRFVKRPNRFLARVRLDNREVFAFCPNPGRMHELMIPGKKMFVRRARNHASRKTQFDLIAVEHEGVLISIDSNLPNRFMREMLVRHKLPQFTGYETVISEPPFAHGRFDFRLEGKIGTTYIEVKSCTLVENRHAIFPDAPTERGARHMRALVQALETGAANDAAVAFVIQRPDADIFSPNDPTDPAFGDALRFAERSGVRVIPIVTELVNWKLEFRGVIPYDLDFFQRERLHDGSS